MNGDQMNGWLWMCKSRYFENFGFQTFGWKEFKQEKIIAIRLIFQYFLKNIFTTF